MTDAPWLDVMRTRIGIREIAGKKHNPAIIQMFADVGHPEIKEDEIAWCAAGMGSALIACSLPIPPKNVNLMARSYLTYGVKSLPKPGAIAIWPRGSSSWQGHVNVVEEVRESNGKVQVKCIGGNQSNAMTRTGWEDADGAIDFRWPVAPTVKDLRNAGSSEIKAADTLEAVAVTATAAGTASSVVNEAVVSTVTPEVVAEKLSLTQQIADGVHGLAKLIIGNPWLVAILVIGFGVVVVSRKWKSSRIKRHLMGIPISNETQRG